MKMKRVLHLTAECIVYYGKVPSDWKSKIIYKDKIVEKVVYKDKPVIHEFIRKEEPKISPQRKELLDVLAELKAKKKKSKKDMENIYTIEKILPNVK